MQTQLNQFLALVFFDVTAIVLDFVAESNYHHNIRWFFIHCCINTLVSILCLPDLLDCINDNDLCVRQEASSRGSWATWLMLYGHLYHCLIFFRHLKWSEWFHHIVFCLPTSYFFYQQNSKIQVAMTYFTSGFPGAVDYFMLLLVKLEIIHSHRQKNLYYYLSAYIRSPGCLLACYLSLPYFFKYPDQYYYQNLFSTILVFLNGQYYNAKTCYDLGKKDSIIYPKKSLEVKKNN